MKRDSKDWRALVRDYKALMGWAARLEPRDPHGAEILRAWAERCALLLCETVPLPLELARSLLAPGRRKVKKIPRRNRRHGGAG